MSQELLRLSRDFLLLVIKLKQDFRSIWISTFIHELYTLDKYEKRVKERVEFLNYLQLTD